MKKKTQINITCAYFPILEIVPCSIYFLLDFFKHNHLYLNSILKDNYFFFNALNPIYIDDFMVLAQGSSGH